MVENRTIKVGYAQTVDALSHSKRKIEAFAFAFVIKIHFVNLCALFVYLVFKYFKLNLSISQNPNS